MFEEVYEWIKSAAYYMVLITVFMQILPGEKYRKYIRFFAGVLLVIILLTPLCKLTGMKGDLAGLYQGKIYEEDVRRIEEAGSYLTDLTGQGAAENYGWEEGTAEKRETAEQEQEQNGNEIRVEEIWVGE